MQFHNENLKRRNDEAAKQSSDFTHDNFQEEFEQYLGLSDAWNELLGIHSLGVQAVPNITAVVPPVASDPWNELLHAQGVEVIDLQQVHLQCVDAPLDDFDVEQALHIMQELHITGTNEG